MALKAATIRAMVISIECPHCGEAWENEKGGTAIVPGDDLPKFPSHGARVLRCQSCNRGFRLGTMPRTA